MTIPAPAVFVPVFAGQGTTAVNSLQALDQAQRDASSSSGSLLLSACHEAFHAELASLPRAELEQTKIVVADFKMPGTLLDIPQEQYSCNPIISGTRQFLLQSLRYLAFTESSRTSSGIRASFEDVLKTNAEIGVGILGFSSGILPACVAAASSTTLQYITRAVEGYRLAFWIGVRLQSYRSHILKKRELPDNCPLSWSHVFHGISKEFAEKAIAMNGNQDGHLCVTAILDENCITISGFPDCFDSLIYSFQADSVVHTNTTIDSLYHSPSHGSTRRLVLADISRRQIRFPDFDDLKIPVRSSFSGGIISRQTSLGPLVEMVVDMLLLQPVNWYLVVHEIFKFHDASIRLVNVGPGSGLIHAMEKVLSREKLKVSVLDLSAAGIGPIHRIPFPQEPIAIIGMAVNMPGARDTSELWELLEKSVNTVSEIPERRFKLSDYNESEHGKPGRSMKTCTGNFIENIDEFDNEFFRISPREAKSMDPQQRLLLHTAYYALEDAGYVPNATRSFQQATFGCYIGAATHDYTQNLKNDIDVYYSTGTLKAFLSGRVSYVMGFCGPSIVVDTACSSSSVAIYQGCRALAQGDCNAALVGGVNVITSPDMYIGLDRGHLLTPGGQCKPFDASANGYSRSEGCGVFVIKRLADALAENDNILGVIRGVEVNQSGPSKSITHPNYLTQKNLIETLLTKAGVDAHRINVVEAHGTGTQAGDTIELASIRSVLSAQRSPSNPLYITTIKANIGHLEAASGVASMAKLLLMLQHHIIPRHISVRHLNPEIAPLQSDHTIIPSTNTQWLPAQDGTTRIALLNNFGAAGSNTALLLEEYPVSTNSRSNCSKMSYVFGFSAKTMEALIEVRSQYLQWLRSDASSSHKFADIAYTMTARRQIYTCRLAVSATDKEELIEKLIRAPSKAGFVQTDVAFVFSGQGGQYLGMGRKLYDTLPLFRDLIDHCHSILVELGSPGILQVINADEGESPLVHHDTECQQTAIVALEYALARLWMSWGLSPCLIIGSSIGEYAALAIANVMTIRDALTLVARRAHLMIQKCPQTGGMLAVHADAIMVQQRLESSVAFSDLSIACFNGPSDCVVAGPLQQVQAFKTYLDQSGHPNTLLPVPFAFHSAAMHSLVDDFSRVTRQIDLNAPTIAVVSTVTGEIVMPGDASVFKADYFIDHCVKPVLFEQGIKSLSVNADFSKIDTFIEIGPHASLLSMLRRNFTFPRDMLLLPSMRKEQDPWSTLTDSLSKLYLANAGVHWREVFAHLTSVSCIKLPSYPFKKHKYWVPFQENSRDIPPFIDPQKMASTSHHALSHVWSQYPSNSNGNVAIFITSISKLADAIQGHRVAGLPLCPVSVYLQQVCGAMELIKRDTCLMQDGSCHFLLGSIEFVNPLVYDPDINRNVETHITLEYGAESFTIASVVQPSHSAEKTIHVRGKLRSQSTYETYNKFSYLLPTLIGEIFDITRQHNRERLEVFSTRTIYDAIFSRVVEYSEPYRTIQSIAVDRDRTEAYATAKLPICHYERDFVVHPALTDTLLHVAGLLANLQGGSEDVFICSEVDSVEMLSDIGDYDAAFGVHCRGSWLQDEGFMEADVFAVQFTLHWKIVAHIKGMRFRRVRLNSLKRGLAFALDVPHFRHFAPSKSWRHQPPTTHNTISHDISKNPRTIHELEVIRVISETCGIDAALHRDTDLESLGVDSLLTIELLQALRDLFPRADLRHNHFLPCRTVGDIIAVVSPEPLPNPSGSIQACSETSSPRTLVHDDDFLESHISNNHGLDAKLVMASVLGINATDLDDNANLVALGLDSLASIEAFHVFQKELRMSLPRDLFAKCPTVRSLHTFLESRCKAVEIVHHPCASIQQFSHDTGSQRQDCLVSIQSHPHASGIPLFLIHDGSGLVNYFNRLPSLDRNTWAIRNPKFRTGDAWKSISNMTAAYTNYISETVSGPLIVGGWSFGGVVAFEVARALLDKEITVKGVLLIDSPSPINHVPFPDRLIDHIVNCDTRETCTNTSALLKNQFRTNSDLLSTYNPFWSDRPWPPLVFLRSVEGYNPPNLQVPTWLADRRSPEMIIRDWEVTVGENIKVLPIPGNHFQAFDPLHVTEVALRIVEGCQYLESL